MKKSSFCLVTLLLAALIGCLPAAARKRTPRKAAYLLKRDISYEPLHVKLTDTATVVTCMYKTNQQQWNFQPQVYLTVGKDTLRFRHGRVFDRQTRKALPLCPDTRYILSPQNDSTTVSRQDSVELVFDPAPRRTTTVMLCEDGDNRHKGRIFGLHTDGKPNRALKKKPVWHSTLAELPEWKPRYGKTIIHAHILGYNPEMLFSMYSNPNSLAGGMASDMKFMNTDTLGNVWFEANLCYPQIYQVELPQGLTYKLLVLPGEDMELVIDLHAFAAARDKAAKQKDNNPAYPLLAAVQSRKGGLPEVDMPNRLWNTWGRETSVLLFDTLQKYVDENYGAYTERMWQAHQKRLHTLENEKNLSGAQREVLKIQSELYYLDQCGSFIVRKRWTPNPPDSAAMAAFQEQTKQKDVHAAQLSLPYSPAAPYLAFNLGTYYYLEKNDLLDTPMGRQLQGLKQAKNKIKQLELEQPVTDESGWAGIDSVYLPYLRELNDTIIAILHRRQEQHVGICDVPDGDPASYLEKIVSAHQGRVVLVDLWATWCGPCVRGIEAMAPLKEELTAKGVDFVYITDESSNLSSWNNFVKQHPGSHYRIDSEKRNAMQIPGFEGSIPHYLIYDRKGRLVCTQRGWPGTEALMEKINKALQQE